MKTRNEILATLADSVQSVPTRAWGTVYVRQLRGHEFDAFWSILEEEAGAQRLASFTVLALCDEQGKRLLKARDTTALLDGPLEPLAAVADAFLTFNAIELDQKKSSAEVATSDSGLPAKSEESLIPIGPLPRYPSGY